MKIAAKAPRRQEDRDLERYECQGAVVNSKMRASFIVYFVFLGSLASWRLGVLAASPGFSHAYT
ncbi:MAG: hypothetical protein AABZ67_11530 [Pseudomonadota bacterium]